MSDETVSKNRDWSEIFADKEPYSRDNCCPNESLGESKKFVDDLRKRIDKEMFVIATEAKWTSDVYWQEQRRGNSENENNQDQQCRIGNRVRVLDKYHTLAIVWFRQTFYKKSPNDKKYSVWSKEIPKKKSGDYSIVSFKNVPLWAKPLILYIENRFKPFRKQSLLLSAMRRLLKSYEAEIKKRENNH